MQTDAEILALVEAAFAHCPRPEHFTDYTHCRECADHDSVLLEHTPRSIGHSELGNAGWDPICFVSTAGFAYYLPALARLALSPEDSQHGWYGPQLLFHLGTDDYNRYLGFSAHQREAVATLLNHILSTRAALADGYGCSDELLHAVSLWAAGAA